LLEKGVVEEDFLLLCEVCGLDEVREGSKAKCAKMDKVNWNDTKNEK